MRLKIDHSIAICCCLAILLCLPLAQATAGTRRTRMIVSTKSSSRLVPVANLTMKDTFREPVSSPSAKLSCRVTEC